MVEGRRGYPSPANWQDEVVYLLMPDRFSDGKDRDRRLLDRGDLAAARPQPWDLGAWARSGYERFQGGTLAGVTSRLDYLAELGVTAIWLTPVFKNRAESDDYHLYAIQHFAEVDPRIGTRDDLVALVAAAHERGLRIILDVIINHTGQNWLYESQLAAPGSPPPPYRDHTQGPYPFGAWLAGDGTPLPRGAAPVSPDDGVWPDGALQDPDAYHRAGEGDYGDGSNPNSAFTQFRWADWKNRDLALTGGPLGGRVLQQMIDVWGDWLEATDCDGFRIDTFKHVRVEEGRTFCAAIRERAEAMGKDDFLLLAEIGGGSRLAEGFLTLDAGALSAALEIGEVRGALNRVAVGWAPAADFFAAWPEAEPREPSDESEAMPTTLAELPAGGSHRALGDAFVYSLEDHDDVGLELLRFATRNPGRTVPAVALVLLTLGIPCLYAGTEQALGVPADLLGQLPAVNDRGNGGDRYLREAMFGPEHPRRAGRAGLPGSGDPFDPAMPGFGPSGTSGHHVFDTANPVFRRIAALLAVRTSEVALRRGRQYLRDVRPDPASGFGPPGPGGLVAWSRILADQEVVCVANLDPGGPRAADVTIDATLTPDPGVLRLLLDTGTLGGTPGRVGPAWTTPDGRRYVPVEVGPAEVLVLAAG